jgi:hypothetical protein
VVATYAIAALDPDGTELERLMSAGARSCAPSVIRPFHNEAGNVSSPNYVGTRGGYRVIASLRLTPKTRPET